MLCVTATVVLYGGGAGWGSVFREDFSTDPFAREWVNTDNSNVQWNASGQFVQARGTDQDQVARWAYSPTFPEISNQPFRVEFDMRPASPSWGTYPLVGLIEGGSGNPFDYAALQVQNHLSGEGGPNFLMNAGPNRVGFSPNFEPDKWYHHSIQYDPDTDVLRWDVSEADSGLPFHSKEYTSVQIGPIDQVAIGYEGTPPAYGRWAEIYVDNLSIIPEPSTVLLSTVMAVGLAIFAWRRRRP